MFKKAKKGHAFTIVELVVVIAVIAVLAAVLIPTFSGIIEQAHKSADASFATAFSTSLAVEMKGEKVKSEAQLAEIYDGLYGEGAYAKLAPKSAKQGYHYWFDSEKQCVILASIVEIQALQAERASLCADANFAYVTPMAGGVAEEEPDFNPLRHIVKGFYFLDGSGSAFAEALNEIMSLNNGGDYDKALAKLDAAQKAEAAQKMVDEAKGKLQNTVIVANGTTYVHDEAPAEADYIVIDGTTTVGAPTNALPKPKGDVLVLPESVTQLDTAALNFADPSVKVEVATEEKAETIVRAESTNATITVKDSGVTYSIDETTLKKTTSEGVTSEVKTDLAYTTPLVDSFTVSSDTEVDNMVNPNVSSDRVFVSVDYTGTISFKADGFKNADGGDNVYSTAVTWSATAGATINPGTGEATLDPAADVEEITITATVNKGGATASITLYVVKANGYIVKLGDQQLSTVNPYSADFKAGDATSFAVTVIPTFNEDSVDITPSFNISSIAASGTEFSYNATNKTLSMVTDENGTPTFSVKEGESARTAKTTLTVTVAGFEARAYNITFIDKSECPLKIKLPNADTYLYFLGNQNEIALSSLFEEKAGFSLTGDVTVKVVDIINSAEETTYVAVELSDDTGLAKKIQFPNEFTGPVTIVVTANGLDITLDAKIVTAKNVTAYGELKNASCVLLNDITMTSGGSYALKNGTLYGNGFTFDVTAGAYTGNKNNLTANYLVSLNNANLDNIKIIGKVYTTYSGKAENDYNRATVAVQSGVCKITNSYISNCAAPLRLFSGTVHAENTTFKGGSFANIDLRGGTAVLKDVTTINQVNGNDTQDFGVGIVIHNESAVDSLAILGSLTQYNYVSEMQASKIADSNAQTLVKKAFGTDFAAIQFTDSNGDVWINAGIISMTSGFGTEKLNDGNGYAGYSVQTANMGDFTGCVWSFKPNATQVTATPSAWVPSTQAPIEPEYVFSYPEKEGDLNYVAKDGNDGCYYSNGKVYISMDEGDPAVSFNTAILNVAKRGEELPYTVTMNGVDYTGKSIAFSVAGEYTLVYSYTDDTHYVAEKGTGKAIQQNATYTQEVKIVVSVIKAAAKTAEFVFANGTPAKLVTIGNETYVMPDVSETSSSIGSTTIDGNTIYYPIVTADLGKTTKKYMVIFTKTYYHLRIPVFKNVVTITDYANGGTGDAITYNASTTSMPSGLSFFGGVSVDAGKSFTTLDLTSAPSSVLKYSAAIDAPNDPYLDSDNVLYFTSGRDNLEKSQINDRGASTIYVKYEYEDNSGKIYYYIVRYDVPKFSV